MKAPQYFVLAGIDFPAWPIPGTRGGLLVDLRTDGEFHPHLLLTYCLLPLEVVCKAGESEPRGFVVL